jgi:hypothetical protein
MGEANAPYEYYAVIATKLNMWKTASYIVLTQTTDLFIVSVLPPRKMNYSDAAMSKDLPHLHCLLPQLLSHSGARFVVGICRRFVWTPGTFRLSPLSFAIIVVSSWATASLATVPVGDNVLASTFAKRIKVKFPFLHPAEPNISK